MIEDLIQEVKTSMDKSVEAFQKDIKRIRTGRASLALLDGIMVDYYGSSTPINQLATLSIPEARQIVIQPWDSQAVPDIEKAILKSELGLTPSNDGKLIRIVLPPLTAERRKELVKVVRKMSEEFKVQVRNHRRDANEMLKEMKKEKEISEDDMHKGQERVQKTTDDYIAKLDKVLAEKEAEIMEI
ncbi:ribosome recycling factor [Desulfomonile tiedjei]|uniref:Ribosome-recycling factor n=1 Tax=Desulfomonile tiedjei (strain ATCC 49306 / DSM 6799 / DCB-1) TaxID=706587 RepID=I4CAM6_DESTA|nr:ribosome recycling factor [Desulfomonile tiedjei]AFM26617.1 ribosome recycling factor [Desulfomonile tiedjei DSM 6799]